MDYFPSNKRYIEIPYGPVQSIDSFTYIHDDGSTVTLIENTDFIVDYDSGICRIYPIDDAGDIDLWPTDVKKRPNAVVIEYTAGYDDVTNPLPEQAKQAILMQLAAMFEQREDARQGEVTMVVWNSMSILDTIKVTWNAHQD